MNIAIDLRVLDGAGAFRGMGTYIRQLLPELLPILTKDHSVTLYVYDEKCIQSLDADEVARCTVITASRPLTASLPTIIQSFLGGILPREYARKNALPNIGEMDIFLQPDHQNGVAPGVPSAVVCHDIIPYIFRSTYFRKPLTLSPRSWIMQPRGLLQRSAYIRSLMVYEQAASVLAVSNHTKKVLSENLDVYPEKVEVIHHGTPAPSTTAKPPVAEPYVVFTGGIDARREIAELIERANHLYVNYGIKTVLVGKDFTTTKNSRIQQALQDPKNAEAVIVTGGLVSDEEVYAYVRHAVASLYPTHYEGFGLPILDAFVNETPIIAFKNSSLPEVGGEAIFFVEDIDDMMQAVVSLSENESLRASYVAKGLKRTDDFSWQKSARELSKALMSLGDKQ